MHDIEWLKIGYFRLIDIIIETDMVPVLAVVEDGVLYIQSPKPGNSNKGSVVAIVSAPKDAINEMTISGYGDVAVTGGFTSPTFKLDHRQW